MDTEKYLSLIQNGCAEKFKKFEELLLMYNKMYNLTSICDHNGIIYKHFLDSICGEFMFTQNAEVVEIGSGGGFPSIPLKIIRDDLKFTLIESTGKKCNYLNEVVDKLQLNCVQVRNLRAEDAACDKNFREKFDVACARAVARLNTLCEYCLPFVKVGGKFIAYKGNADDEIVQAENAIAVLGASLEKVIKFELPECGERTLICIKKIKPTPAGYPRGQGKERKKPL